MKKKISKRYLQIIKADLYADERMNLYLSDYAKIGFLVKHKQREEEMEKMQEKLHHMMIRAEADNKFQLMLQINHEIRENNKRLAGISLGTPIIAQIKAQLEATTIGQGSTGISDTEDYQPELSNRQF